MMMTKSMAWRITSGGRAGRSRCGRGRRAAGHPGLAPVSLQRESGWRLLRGLCRLQRRCCMSAPAALPTPARPPAHAPNPAARPQEKSAPSKGLPVKAPDGRLIYAEAVGSARAKKLRAAAQAAAAAVGGILIEDTIDDEERRAKEAAAAAKAAAEAERAARVRERREAEAAAAAAAAGGAGGEGGAPPPALLALAAARGKEARRAVARQQMAAAAQQLLAAPERYAPVGLRVLNEMARDGDPQVARLAMLSALAVFRDVLPEYKIRPPSEAELAVKASREVQATRDHEAALLKAYQAFLKTLLAAADAAPPRGGGKGGQASGRNDAPRDGGGGKGQGPKAVESALASARVAVRCLAGLLAARPGFNYSSDILQVWSFGPARP
jgi:nucleolar complex protein 3